MKQNIRNKNTLASKAVSELEGDYRWALTGTPITNGLDDLYGLFRFICAPKFSDWDNFRDHISQPAKRNPDVRPLSCMLLSYSRTNGWITLSFSLQPKELRSSSRHVSFAGRRTARSTARSLGRQESPEF